MNIQKSIIATMIASLSSQTTIWPSEVLKMNLQKYPSKTVIEATKDILRRDGIIGFTRGFGAAACSNIPKECVRFTIYNNLKARGYGYTACTVPTILINTILTTPLINITISRIISTKTNIWTILANGYRGFYSVLIKNSVTTGTRFNTQRWLDNVTGWHTSVSGGIATGVSSLTSNPIDVVLTHLQTDYKGQYQKSMKCATLDLYKQFGASVFMRGAGVRCMRAIPGGAVMFSVYDYIIRNY